MWNWILIGGASLIAGFIALDDSNNSPPPPTPVQVERVVAAPNDSLESFSGAMYWIGGCSVVCSTIGAFTVINLAKLRRRDRR